MRQVMQPIDGRATEVVETPAPACGENQILIANRWSLISAGTERGLVELAKKSLLDKARARPDQVRRVVEKVQTEGLLATFDQVRARLAKPMPLGYCSAGTVLQVGRKVRGISVGDRVASNGPHAELVAVGQNLVAKVPENVPLDHACYAVLGAIALQGVRLARVQLGETVAVIGLGLVGQLAAALLRSAGCTVLGADPDESKRQLALRMGADQVAHPAQFEELVTSRTQGRGADAVLITASTPSNGPIEQAATVARQKGRIVAVGAVGMEVPRREFYPKELELVVSCSYGPGRYDPEYEEQGIDYPYAYVRWTEQRNIAAILDLMARGSLDVSPLTTHRFPIERAVKAYELIQTNRESFVGLLIEYPELPDQRARVELPARPLRNLGSARSIIGVSVVGCGTFASGVLIPALARIPGVRLRGVVSATGTSARSVGRRFGFAFAASDLRSVLEDSETDAVILATRHDLHVPQAIKVLEAGKHALIEKPLAITLEAYEDWSKFLAAQDEPAPTWMIGYNRRFSPLIRRVREAFTKVPEPRNILIRMNAGSVPTDHWTQNPATGGGPLLGEACHAVDLAIHLAGSMPVALNVETVPTGRPGGTSAVLSLRFEDGSLATLLYTTEGDRSLGKEWVEVHAGGMSAIVDDFRRLNIHHRGRRLARESRWQQAKGHPEELRAFLEGVATGTAPIPAEELLLGNALLLRAILPPEFLSYPPTDEPCDHQTGSHQTGSLQTGSHLDGSSSQTDRSLPTMDSTNGTSHEAGGP